MMSCLGSYDGRAVAVKRMLTRFFEVAKSEVDMLMAADIHPSVLRYYCMERYVMTSYVVMIGTTSLST